MRSNETVKTLRSSYEEKLNLRPSVFNVSSEIVRIISIIKLTIYKCQKHLNNKTQSHRNYFRLNRCINRNSYKRDIFKERNQNAGMARIPMAHDK